MTSKLHGHNCPHCGAEMDHSTDVTTDKEVDPSAGEAGICTECAEWIEYAEIDGQIHLVVPSPSTMDKIRADPKAAAIQTAVLLAIEKQKVRDRGGIESGRMVFQKEGDFVCAYFVHADANLDTDDLEKSGMLLAKIRPGLVKGENRLAYVEVLKTGLSDIFGKMTGARTEWVSQPAPDNPLNARTSG